MGEWEEKARHRTSAAFTEPYLREPLMSNMEELLRRFQSVAVAMNTQSYTSKHRKLRTDYSSEFALAAGSDRFE